MLHVISCDIFKGDPCNELYYRFLTHLDVIGILMLTGEEIHLISILLMAPICLLEKI